MVWVTSISTTSCGFSQTISSAQLLQSDREHSMIWRRLLLFRCTSRGTCSHHRQRWPMPSWPLANRLHPAAARSDWVTATRSRLPVHGDRPELGKCMREHLRSMLQRDCYSSICPLQLKDQGNITLLFALFVSHLVLWIWESLQLQIAHDQMNSETRLAPILPRKIAKLQKDLRPTAPARFAHEDRRHNPVSPVHSRQSFENSHPSSVSPTYARAKIGERYLQRARTASAGLCVCVCVCVQQNHNCTTVCMRAAISAFATKERNVSWPLLHRVFRNKRWYNARRIQDLAISEIVRIIFKERKWWRIRTGSLLFYSIKLWIPQNNRTDRYHHHLAAAIWSKIVGLAIFQNNLQRKKMMIILLRKYDRSSSVSQSCKSNRQRKKNEEEYEREALFY